MDNRDHLDEGYIEEVLENLPEKQRARFLKGLWVKGEGCIYERFEENMIVPPEKLPEMDYYTAGQDFGLNITNVKIGYSGEKVYIVRDHGGHNTTTRSFNEQLTALSWFDDDMPVYCDPAGGELIQEITGGQKANNAMEPGIDHINSLIEQGLFFVC